MESGSYSLMTSKTSPKFLANLTPPERRVVMIALGVTGSVAAVAIILAVVHRVRLNNAKCANNTDCKSLSMFPFWMRKIYSCKSGKCVDTTSTGGATTNA